MSNEFIQATAYAIDKHGLLATYSVITEGAYNIDTGSTTNTSADYSLKMYMKHLKTNQFSYPNLVGKTAGMFYILAYNLAFTPSVRDVILYSGKSYVVDSIQSHAAGGQIVLYRVVAAA